MLASLTIGMGVTLFTSLEGKSQSEAVYASVIAGKLNACKRRFSFFLNAYAFVAHSARHVNSMF